MSTKEELQRTNDKFKNELEAQLNRTKHNFDKVGKTALIIGGGLLGVYLLSELLADSPSKDKAKKGVKNKERPINTVEKQLISTLKEQAIVFLLRWASQKLTDFLKDLNNKTDDEE